jgi:hypothetical protein
MTIAELAREAESLPEVDKARLAGLLLEQIGEQKDPGVEQAWVEEAQRRLAAFNRGEMVAVDGPTAMADLRKRFGL